MVHVHLVELGGGVLLGELLQHWGNHLARAAPDRKEVDDDQVGCGDCVFEFFFGGDDGDHCAVVCACGFLCAVCCGEGVFRGVGRSVGLSRQKLVDQYDDEYENKEIEH